MVSHEPAVAGKRRPSRTKDGTSLRCVPYYERSIASVRKRLLEQLVAWIRQTQEPWLERPPVG